MLADVSQKKRGTITSATLLADLGFDSLMFTELAVALEAAGVEVPDPAEITGLESVADVEKLVARLGAKQRTEKPKRDRLRREKLARDKADADKLDDDIDVPKPLVSLGRRALRNGMKALYSRVLETDIYGQGSAYRPRRSHPRTRPSSTTSLASRSSSVTPTRRSATCRKPSSTASRTWLGSPPIPCFLLCVHTRAGPPRSRAGSDLEPRRQIACSRRRDCRTSSHDDVRRK